MQKSKKSPKSKKSLRAGIINYNIGNRSAQGQDRLVWGNPALMLTIKFG